MQPQSQSSATRAIPLPSESSIKTNALPSKTNIRSLSESLLPMPLERYRSMTYDERAKDLLSEKRPYYVYTENEITLDKRKDVQTVLKLCKNAVTSKEYNSYCFDVMSEQYVLDALKSHQWRINKDVAQSDMTIDNNNNGAMMVHIVTTPLIALLGVGCREAHNMKRCLKKNMNKPYIHKHDETTRSVFDPPFTALTTHPNFIKQQGGRYHVLSSIQYTLFARHEDPSKNKQLSKWFGPLQNVTVAHHYDAIAIHSIYQNDVLVHNKTVLHDYIPLFEKRSPLVQYVFVLGIGIDLSIPLQIPNIDNYKRQDLTAEHHSDDRFFIFYRTRTRPSRHNSTVYRLAPLNMVNTTTHPVFNSTYSSIGHDLPHDTWLDHMSRSQFCLAIRGDSPHTHALVRTIRAGCMPVVISDYYPQFGSPLSSIVAMEEYSIMIPEAEFISNPTQALLKLRDIPTEILQSKIQALQFLQRVLFPDHPDTLFVPAYLKQVMVANERKAWPWL